MDFSPISFPRPALIAMAHLISYSTMMNWFTAACYGGLVRSQGRWLRFGQVLAILSTLEPHIRVSAITTAHSASRHPTVDLQSVNVRVATAPSSA